jgi:hypothetical protein
MEDRRVEQTPLVMPYSLRVAVVFFVFLIVIFFAVVFVLFLVWLLSEENLGSYRLIRKF